LVLCAAAVHVIAGLQEFARYYGFYAGADKADQGAMAFGSNANNLQSFKDRFRWAYCLHATAL
jgi:hypothetical protein